MILIEINQSLDYLSPTAPVGLLILSIGTLFTVGTFYIFFTLDRDSVSDKEMKIKKAKEQAEKIKRLSP